MARSLYDWLYRSSLPSQARLGLLILTGVMLTGMVSGGVWYYVHRKAAEKAEQLARRAQALQQKRASVTSFYSGILTGGDAAGFLRLYQEILRSRLPIEITGFTAVSFSCTTESCDFSYKARDNAIFSVQPLQFRGGSYPPSFSESTVSYSGIPSELGSNPLLDAFRQQAPISQPECSELLSYLYSYNSLVQPGLRFKLKELPSSSVTATEQSLPGNPENYGLLAGKWQVSLPDNAVSMDSFWRDRPYSSSFIFQSVSGKQGTVELSGTFVCKSKQ